MHERLGIDVGQPGQSLQAAKQALAERGVAVEDRTIWRLRLGKQRSGEVIARRMAAAAQLRANDASAKTRFYLRLAELGATRRQYEQYNRRAFRTNGLLALLASELGCDLLSIRCAIHAMRADVLLWIHEFQDLEVAQTFDDGAWVYLHAHVSRTRPKTTREGALLLRDAWTRGRFLGFYGQLYALPGPRTVMGWLPYELWDMRWFYQRQVEDDSQLTPFDTLALSALVRRSPRDRELRDYVQQHTGVVLADPALGHHRNVLLHGTPLAPHTPDSLPIPGMASRVDE